MRVDRRKRELDSNGCDMSYTGETGYLSSINQNQDLPDIVIKLNLLPLLTFLKSQSFFFLADVVVDTTDGDRGEYIVIDQVSVFIPSFIEVQAYLYYE